MGQARSVRPADFRIYLVTDRRQTRQRPLVDTVEAALGAGVGAVQLRERGLTTRELLALAHQLREVTAHHGAALLINDRIDVAMACQADGVHLPVDSFAIRDARVLLGPDRLIGVSTHHPDEVAAAALAGADFAVFGPVVETPSKLTYGPPLGLSSLARATARSRIPVLAIGGVTVNHIPELLQAGVDGVAVIRAILDARDPAAAAAALIAAIAIV